MEKKIDFYQKTFQNYLNKYLQSLKKRQPKELYEPIHYILDSDAKYIRPVLCLLTCEMYGKNHSHALPAALSVELFHTFSLVHDDILDNSPIRRGKKTIHSKWNTNIAILAGDLLLIEAYQLLAQYNAATSHELLKVFSSASVQICEGQQEDMNFEKKSVVTSAEYLEMIRKKTSVLIGTAMQMGGIVAGISISEQKKIYRTGENIGIAFQIMDDYLDTFGNVKTFGKKIGNDILTNKKTFLLTKSLETANKNQLNRLLKSLKMPPSKEKIQVFKNIYQELGIDTLAIQTTIKLHQKISQDIKQLKAKNTAAQTLLTQLSEQLLQRKK